MKNSTKLDLDLFENLKLELRRGCLIVAVLAQLRQEHYGYTLRKALDDLGLAIDEGTLSRCFVAWKRRDSWPVNGVKRTSATSVFTGSHRRVN